MFNSVLWILIPPAEGDGKIGEWGDTTKYVNHEPILKLKKCGYSLNDIISLYNDNSINFNIKNRVINYYDILQKHDEICNIKVCDFIKQNIRKYKLFYTQNHPTSYIMAHCVNQIFKILGVSFELDVFSYPLNVTHISSASYPHSLYDKQYWNFEYNA